MRYIKVSVLMMLFTVLNRGYLRFVCVYIKEVYMADIQLYIFQNNNVTLAV